LRSRHNWILRIFAPHIDVAYDRKAALLLRYEGVSNVSDASGQRQKVEIRYTYPAGETTNLQHSLSMKRAFERTRRED